MSDGSGADFHSSLPSPLPNDATLGLPARLPLAPHDLPVALSKIVAAEEVRLDLEDRGATLLCVPAVHTPARARGAVKLGEEDLVVSMLIFASFLAYAPEPISTLHPDAGGREPCCRSACA